MASTKKIQVQEHFTVLWKKHKQAHDSVSRKKLLMLIKMSAQPIYDCRTRIAKPIYSNRKLSKALHVSVGTVQNWKKKYELGGVAQLLAKRDLKNKTITKKAEDILVSCLLDRTRNKTFVEIVNAVNQKANSRIGYDNLLKYVKRYKKIEYAYYKESKAEIKHNSSKIIRKKIREIENPKNLKKEKQFKCDKKLAIKIKIYLASEKNLLDNQICRRISKSLKIEFSLNEFWIFLRRYLKKEGSEWLHRLMIAGKYEKLKGPQYAKHPKQQFASRMA